MMRYDKYKDSGVEWINKIPEHWHVKRLKYFLNRNDGGVWGDDYDGIPKNATKVFRSTEINIDGSWNFDEEPALRVLSDHEKEKALLREGDLLVTKSSGSQLHIGKTALVTRELEDQNCCYSNFMQRLRPLNKESSKYLHIFLNSNLARDQYNYLSNSTTGLANLSAGLLNDVLLSCPRLEEQTAIASYLDKKTKQLDELITSKQKLVELLKEERAAIINQAVTRGIDPNVKLKSSGIDWLGDIPAHWEVKKLKYVAKINPESLSENEDENLLLKYIDIGSVDSDGSIILTTELLYCNAPSRARRIVRKGDTILSTVRTYLKAIAFINDDSQNMICSTGFAVIRPLELFVPKFIYYICRSQIINELIMSLSKGVSYPAIDSEDFKSIFVCYPEKTEQDEIVRHVENESLRINNTISKIEKEIELLQEYRTALISEVVTGKIKVV